MNPGEVSVRPEGEAYSGSGFVFESKSEDVLVSVFYTLNMREAQVFPFHNFPLHIFQAEGSVAISTGHLVNSNLKDNP